VCVYVFGVYVCLSAVAPLRNNAISHRATRQNFRSLRTTLYKWSERTQLRRKRAQIMERFQQPVRENAVCTPGSCFLNPTVFSKKGSGETHRKTLRNEAFGVSCRAVRLCG
jgi:hypothetical protein